MLVAYPRRRQPAGKRKYRSLKTAYHGATGKEKIVGFMGVDA